MMEEGFCRLPGGLSTEAGGMWVSGAGELPPCALSEPDLNLSAYPAPIIQPLVSFPIANAETARAAYGLFAPTSIPPWSDGVSTF